MTNGADGTTRHNESSNKRVTEVECSNPCTIIPCKNHLQTYIDGWGQNGKRKIKVEDLVKGKVNTNVTKETVAKGLAHLNEAVEQLNRKWSKYSVVQNRAKSSRKRSPQERQLRGVLKHIAKYGNETALHTFPVRSFTKLGGSYEVKQMLVGPWTCNCPDYSFKDASQKELGYECKHIVKAKRDPKNAMDISYGEGAIEAHARLTKIASEALGEPVVNSSTRYFLEYYSPIGDWAKSREHPGNYTKKEAERRANDGHNSLTYRIVPVTTTPPVVQIQTSEPVQMYNVQFYDRYAKKYKEILWAKSG